MENHISPDSERRNLFLEEYKILVEDRRFLMTRYMQGLALYLALMGLALRILFEVNDLTISLLFVTFLTVVNILAAFMANRFKSMALHVMNREEFIANKLGMQEPHSMIWGYKVGISAFILVQIGIIGIAFIQNSAITGL